jgi:hypothetical protein
MAVTEERLFTGREICNGAFGRDGAGSSSCGHGCEGCGCLLVKVLRMLVVEMLRVTELVVRVLRVARVGWEKREWHGVVGEVIGELVMVSAAGPDGEHWLAIG